MVNTATQGASRTSVHVPAEIQRRVDAGAAWLDSQKPRWVDEINLASLDLRNSCSCVLGQMVRRVDPIGHFDDVVADPTETKRDARARAPHGLKKMVLSADQSIDLGFHIGHGEGVRGRTKEWDQLTAAWRRLIVRRRKAEGPSPKESAA